jgi:hypothetical protein
MSVFRAEGRENLCYEGLIAQYYVLNGGEKSGDGFPTIMIADF